MHFIAPGVSSREALQQAFAAPHDAESLRAARRASDALQALLATAGPELLAWCFAQACGTADPAGLDAFAASVEEARDAAQAIAH